MAYSGVRELIIENRHNGERLAMRRVKRGDEVWLELKGSAPRIGKGLLSIFTSPRMRKDSSGPARCRLCSMVADSPQARKSRCRSLAGRPTGGGTTGTSLSCSKAMRGPQWTWTDFFKRSSKSSTQARTAGLRSSTWPIFSYGIVIRRPYSSCRGRFKPCCFE